MRTTITIDDDLFAKAAAVVGEENVSNVVMEALKRMISAEARKRLVLLAGSGPDFDVAPRANRVAEEKED